MGTRTPSGDSNRMELGEEKVQVKKDTAGEDNVIGERVVLSQFFSFLLTALDSEADL